MKAVVYENPMQVAVMDVPKPKIQNPRDAIVRLTSSAICGSDLHMYEGHTAMKPGRVVGHEPMGVVEEVGDAVVELKPGDRVVMPFNIACGVCMNCVRGFTNACLTLNREKAGAGYGYVGLGPYQGAQAEYVLVPFADWACLKLPGTPGDQFEDDFVLLADIFPTSYYSTEMANVSAGKSVAVFGAGPVGLLAAYSALLKWQRMSTWSIRIKNAWTWPSPSGPSPSTSWMATRWSRSRATGSIINCSWAHSAQARKR
jgi:glutathione-independent formaldehyde dehydrogenase